MTIAHSLPSERSVTYDSMRGAGPVALVGGRGYMGGAIAGALAAHAIPFWIVGRQPSTDVDDPAYRSSLPGLSDALVGAETVVHLASVSTPALGFADPLLDIENIRLTVSLITACSAVRTRHVIFISSGGTVYGDASAPLSEDAPLQPLCSYGVGKATSEAYLRLFHQQTGTPVTILRVSNAYGGRQFTKGEQGVISAVVRRIRDRGQVTLFGNTVRDYVHVEDVAQAVRAAAAQPDGLRILNISTGIGTSLGELTNQLATVLKCPVEISVGARRPFDALYNVLANDRARAELGWSPQVLPPDGFHRAVRELT